MEVTAAREAAQSMVLELQAERVVMAVLEELYTLDEVRRRFLWGRDLELSDLPEFMDRITERVVYGKDN